MKPDEKERLIDRLMKYQEQVNGFPPTYNNKLYALMLTDSQLRAVYKKWQEWAKNKSLT